MTSALERRVEALEAATGGGGGCPRCVGTMTIVSDAVSERFHSTSWNGEPLDQSELEERQAETKCPKCGRRINPAEQEEIKIGGRRGV